MSAGQTFFQWKQEGSDKYSKQNSFREYELRQVVILRFKLIAQLTSRTKIPCVQKRQAAEQLGIGSDQL